MAQNTVWKVAAVLVIVASGILLVLGVFGMGLFPRAPLLRSGSTPELSPRFLAQISATFLLFGGMYVAGWAIWWRRRWGRILFLVALPIYLVMSFLPGMKQGPIFWLGLAILSFPFEMLLIHARRTEPAVPQPAPTAGAPSETGGALPGMFAAAVAVVFLALGVAFGRIGHPLAISAAVAFAVAIAVLLVLCRWQAWNRVIATVTLAAAACELLAVFALRFVDFSQLPPLSRIPILAASGFLHQAALGAPLPVLMTGFLEGAVPGATLLFLAGIPFLLSPPRPLAASALATQLAGRSNAVLATATAVALGIPLASQLTQSSPSTVIAPNSTVARAPIPPPPPAPAPPKKVTVAPEAPIGPAESGAQLAGVPGIIDTNVDRAATKVPEAPKMVSIGSLKVVKRVAPEYPRAAKAAGRTGAAVIEATIDRNGRVVAVRRVRGNDDFIEASSTAMMQWVFVPYMVAGETRSVTTVVTFNFIPQ